MSLYERGAPFMTCVSEKFMSPVNITLLPAEFIMKLWLPGMCPAVRTSTEEEPMLTLFPLLVMTLKFSIVLMSWGV